jgi:hypothetical protein
MIYACGVSSFLNSRFSSLLACSLVIVCRRACLRCVSSHFVPFFLHVIFSCIIHGIHLMHASHSCIIVTESSEIEPVEPTESAEPEPGVQFVVEPEVNQGKHLSMIPCSYLI